MGAAGVSTDPQEDPPSAALTPRMDGFRVIRGLLDDDTRRSLHRAALDAETVEIDPQVPETPVAYGTPRMEQLLEELRPRIEAETALALHPTYSFLRLYKRGDRLGRHVDREACEISVSINLGYAPEDAGWALWVEHAGERRAILLAPGDALIYRGMEVPHWRERFEGDQAVQVFLHYVDQHGPHAPLRYDGRPALGTSSVG
jgi:alkylated DNA repair dioxygenase AlkB